MMPWMLIRSWTGDDTPVPEIDAALSCGQKSGRAARLPLRLAWWWSLPGRWSVGWGFAAPLAARSARCAVAYSKAEGFSAPLAQMPGVFRRPVARPRRLL